MGYVSCQFSGIGRNVSEIGVDCKNLYMLIFLFFLPSNFIQEMYTFFINKGGWAVTTYFPTLLQ